jgi:hypothetical protein
MPPRCGLLATTVCVDKGCMACTSVYYLPPPGTSGLSQASLVVDDMRVDQATPFLCVALMLGHAWTFLQVPTFSRHIPSHGGGDCFTFDAMSTGEKGGEVTWGEARTPRFCHTQHSDLVAVIITLATIIFLVNKFCIKQRGYTTRFQQQHLGQCHRESWSQQGGCFFHPWTPAAPRAPVPG